MNAQGEDVVAGIRTPKPIDALREVMPKVYEEFVNITKILEGHYKDMQDIEFTVEKERLYILQTRSGKRTTNASINIAVDMVNENLISKEEAVLRIDPNQLNQLLHPNFDENIIKECKVLAKGLPASPGAASGKIFFNAHEVVSASASGESCILVRLETSPEDIEGMICAKGILTARGGMTSHAAVVARGMGKCCIAGCGDVKVNERAKEIRVGDILLHEGDFISLDGSTGNVYVGDIPKVEVGLVGKFDELMKWVDEIRTLKVRTNADTPFDASVAVKFGAEGIGLCRTEHMFFDDERIPVVRRMILSKNIEERLIALEKLLPMQKEDFIGIFKAMGERPVTIRLLDPPLHEFLPKNKEDVKALAISMDVSLQEIEKRIEDLEEFNPMLGHRGCRLAITYPEIYVMQTRAIIEGAIEAKKSGINVSPEIMIPLIGDKNELSHIKKFVVDTANEIINENNIELKYLVGTMIEVPRAAITADEIAKEAEFFSFGTNDLTQMAYGFSRDDAGKFLMEYENKGLFEKDPFQVIDRVGVGKLMKLAIKLGKESREDIKLGICGEHGGEPSSVEFCHSIGLHYVSCSPFRVPIARLAAAQAVIKNK